jgi:hypothetical protein
VFDVIPSEGTVGGKAGEFSATWNAAVAIVPAAVGRGGEYFISHAAVTIGSEARTSKLVSATM